MGLNNILLRIKSKGYTPVLAHPERYNYMEESDYRQLKGLSVKFQLNLFSLVGAYGTEVRKKARWLMKKVSMTWRVATHTVSLSWSQLYTNKITTNRL